MSAGQDAVDEGIFPPRDARLGAAFRRALLMHEARNLVLPQIVKVANPAVGTDWSKTVPAGTVWWVETLTATLTASAVAGTRTPRLALTDGTTTFARLYPAANITVSGTGILNWVRDYGDHLDFGSLNGQAMAFPSIPLVGGMRIAASTNNIDAGDQWSAIAFYVLEVRQRTLNELAQLADALDDGSYDNTYPGLRLGL